MGAAILLGAGLALVSFRKKQPFQLAKIKRIPAILLAVGTLAVFIGQGSDVH